MWIVYAFLVHVALLGSIFVIYFRSPVITGLQPQESLVNQKLQPPAKRLVLLVTDGLRAESFFRHNCSDIPRLQSLMLHHGLVGISHTRVPTESRPGHIALIAGFYEDPSAVMRGWKENPIDFDTVFNRSRKTYAWGANDIVHIFSRMEGSGRHGLLIDAYRHDLDFSGREDTFALDEWVFSRVENFLKQNGKELQNETQVVFFLHLLGLDSAGHINKPGTKLFLDNLHRTDEGILKIYEEFERTFPDGQTAYVLTSDHGMTDSGAHGAGELYETETPFFVWGSGVKRRASHVKRSFQVGSQNTLPLHEIEQAQVTPLMSALLGLAPPTNNFGKLPLEFLNVTAEYGAHAAHSNALQLLEQFNHLLSDQRKGVFTKFLRKYEKLDELVINSYKRTIADLLNGAEYTSATNISYKMMDYALEGIDYYHNYYRNVLLGSTVLTFVGWMYYLMQLLLESGSKHPSKWRFPVRLYAMGIVFIALCFLQSIPLVVTFYLGLPFMVWSLPIGKTLLTSSSLSNVMSWKRLLPIILFAELLVLTFFERRFISLCFLLFVCTNNWLSFSTEKMRAVGHVLLIVAIAAVPMLPPCVGYKNSTLVIVGMILALAQPLLSKSHLSKWRIAVCGVALINTVLCIYQHSQQKAVSPISLVISWSFMIYAIGSVLLGRPSTLKHRLELIFINFSSLYALFCTSYELLFVLMLGSELMLALLRNEPVSHVILPVRKNMESSFRLAGSILLYTFLSFFGSGNIASLNSFDPNIIRCFLTTFSPFVITALVILKLIIPVVLNVCITLGLSAFARTHQREIFICLLLICDVMGLNFLFLVRNQGSWLEIGSSISHFVIIEATSLVLLLITALAKTLLRLGRPMEIKMN